MCIRFSVLFATLALLGACNSSPQPQEETTHFVYQHTRETIWNQTRSELGERWRIADEDEIAMTFTTDWDTHLHVMNTFGKRHRLTVTLAGTDEEGYQVTASQETEQNTNQDNPLVASEAEWDSAPSNGALAQRFLMNLHLRMNPGTPWREDADR
ncbi:MAG: hypothetical protein CMJ83_06940 [Planctomycetes bacterium]|nr:hypothetical protein [Planctomycetota bacterium]